MAQEISTNTPGTASQSSVSPATSWIQKTPGVCGGDACIRNTRITVWGLVAYRNLGLSDTRLLEIIVSLTSADLKAAWDYYEHNGREIDEEIRLNEDA